MKSPEDSERAFRYLEDLVRFLKSFPRVQFLTASTAAARFHDRAQNHIFSTQEVAAIAAQVDPQVTFQTGDSFNLSASEVFFILNKFLAGIIRSQSGEPLLLERTPYGPVAAAPPLAAKLIATWPQVSKAVLSVQDEMEKTGRIPNSILLGSQTVPPESYLAGIAQAVQNLMQNAAPPDSVAFPPARLAAADYVADDSPEIWDWVIFPRGFHAPRLMSLAKLQAWTLKPAK
jgi:hypothetical protein